MAQVVLVSKNITAKELFPLKNITQINIANYGNTVAEVYINGYKRFVPAFNDAVGVPQGDICLHDNGNVMRDIKIDFRQDNTNLIFDYYEIIEDQPTNQNCN